MRIKRWIILLLVVLSWVSGYADPGDKAGPYAHWYNDDRSNIPDKGVPGFVGPDGDGKNSNQGPQNYVNPIFVGWATGYTGYTPAPDVDNAWLTPEETLDVVTGHNFHIASLGDLSQDEIDDWISDPDQNPGPGEITLTFDNPITNGGGADFVVFENGFENNANHLFFAELAFVEVSTDGIHFARFGNKFLAADAPVGGYAAIDTSYIYNLAGKHANAYGDSWGTPFDLDTLANHSLVIAGDVGLDDINYVKIVDIPGSGDFEDSDGNAIYDAWVTTGSGGFDLEAVGVIHQKVDTPKPKAITLSATTVASSSAMLKGIINPNTNVTNVYFEYGTTENYGATTNNQDVGSGDVDVTVDATVDGILADTLYHYRIVAVNDNGTNYGEDMTFTTLSEATGTTPSGTGNDPSDAGDTSSSGSKSASDGSCFIRSIGN